ncbi:MAG: AAA family ATPase, partial [Clostridia bacterium]|nr:AAA family ATPase [Clostridia bacterium]
MLTKKLPVGIDSFEKLRREDFYYVDKTRMIVDLMANWGEVNLFTRPRRFGKTLNMSMLKCFFEIGTDKSLFDGLAVSKEKALCEKYMGKYPVVFVSLKDVDGLTFETAYQSLCQLLVAETTRLCFLQESDRLAANEKAFINRMLHEQYTEMDIRGSLKMLCSLLEKHYGQKPILLIDEYDVPLDKAYYHGYYPQMIDLIRAMFQSALKTNSSLFFAVLTGCLRVSKESIFTGLNNLMVHSISDPSFDEYFGFTDEEVGKMLSDYGLEAHHQEAREWYDGYRFGGQDVYCPWDVINYVYALRVDPQAEPKAYWLNTSGNAMVRELISKSADGTTQMEIERLIEGETITKTLNEQLTHNEIRSSIGNIWSLLYMTGYLTTTQRPSGGRYALRIPNR